MVACSPALDAGCIRNKLSNFPLSLADVSHECQIHVSVRILAIKINH